MKPPARDRFLIATMRERVYVVHTLTPRFVCEVVRMDSPYDYAPGDVITWLEASSMFVNFDWIDFPPSPEVVADLMERAMESVLTQRAIEADRLKRPR